MEEHTTEEKIAQLYKELIDAEAQKKLDSKLHGENIKRIREELKELSEQQEQESAA